MIKNKKLQINVVTLLLLCLGLCIASFAIAYVTISYDVKNNYFHTGVIDIDLNGDKPIIGGKNDANLLFAPGMTVTKEFYIQNRGREDVFYELEFEEGVEGNLADVLEIEIYKEEGSQKKVLLEGTIKNIKLQIADELKAGQKQYLFAQFHMPENTDDRYKGGVLQFDMSAIAVQAKNNDPENPKFK